MPMLLVFWLKGQTPAETALAISLLLESYQHKATLSLMPTSSAHSLAISLATSQQQEPTHRFNTIMVADWGASSAFTFNQASNVLSIGGNVTANYLIGNGSQITGLTSTYGNANVAAFLPTYTGDLSGGNLALTGNAAITGGLTTSNNIVSGANIQAAGNIRTTGPSGNITGVNYASANFFVGNGSLLTGVVATSTYGNANVVANLAALGSNPVSTTGNISAGYFLGNGSQLTGLPATYSNANVAAFMAAFGSNTITTTGNITAGNVNSTGVMTATTFSGNLSGSSATLATANLISGPLQVASLAMGSSVASVGYANIILTGGTGGSQTYIDPTGLNTAGNVSATGNVTGNYFIGNGSQLTGLPATYSNVNVASFMANFGSNSISTSGNVTASYHIGNGSLLSSITGGNVSGTVANATYATTAGSATTATTAGTVTSNAQANITSVGTLTSLAVTGNIDSGNLRTTGLISATGNITGNFFVGNGSLLTGIVSSYGNANVVANLAALGSNPVSTTGNVTASYHIGNGSLLTGIVSSYGNANVVANLAALGSNPVSTTGNITGGNINATVVSATGNVQAGNLRTTGLISASGNVTGNFFVGNGSALTGIVSSYGNANVVANLAALGSNPVSTTGNITANFFVGNGSALTGITSSYGNANVVANLAALGSNPVSTTGNVTAGYFVGNGSALTGIVSSYGNANVVANLAALGSNPVSTTGNVTAGYFVGNGSLLTNLTGANVTGTVANATYATTAGSATTATSATTASTVTGNAQANITSVGTLTSLAVTGNASAGNITTAGLISATGNITGNFFVGNGSALTGITSSYGNANVVANLAALGSNPVSTTGNVTAGYFAGNGSLLTSITGANVTGTVANATTATTAGTVTTAAQANITSVGTLTSLAVTGNASAGNITTVGLISATGNVSGNFFIGNGSLLTGIATSSFGNANVAANLAAFGSNPISSTGNITTTGIVTANSFVQPPYTFGNATGTITPDINLGSIQTLTLTGNVTFNSIGNIITGQSAQFIMIQDATGNRALTSTMKFASNVRTLSTAANSIDLISVVYSGTTYYASLTRGYA